MPTCRRLAAPCVLLLLLALLAPTGGALANVPMTGGNAARTGVHAGPGPSGQPVELWHRDLRGEGPLWPYQAVAEGAVFVVAGDGAVVALEAATGAERWRAHGPADDPILGGNPISPAALDGVVYVVGPTSRGSALLALDAATGAERWHRDYPHWMRGGAPAVVDGALYVVGTDQNEAAHLFALALPGGEERWRAPVGEAGDPVRQSDRPAVANGVVYAGGEDRVVALDAATGRERWRASVKLPWQPVAADGAVYVVAFEEEKGDVRLALDAATGEPLWSTPAGSPLNWMAATGGMVYAPAEGGAVEARDGATGEQRWRVEVADHVAEVALANGVVYVAGAVESDGRSSPLLATLEAGSGEERWRVVAEGEDPLQFLAITGGVVSGRSGNDVVHAFGGSGGRSLRAGFGSVPPQPGSASATRWSGAVCRHRQIHPATAGIARHRRPAGEVLVPGGNLKGADAVANVAIVRQEE